jgi:hypothetical protein
MCNATAALTMQGAGAASSAVGAYYGAASSKASLNLQASLAEINAGSIKDTAAINQRLAESTAQQTLLTGEREVQRSQMATANLKGSQRASMAANGIVLGEGTANQVLTSTDVMGEIDANTLQANAVRGAWGYRTQSVAQTNQSRTQAANLSSQGAMSRAAAGAVSPSAAATTSLLGSAGQVAGSWYQYNKSADVTPTTKKSFGPQLDSFFFKSNRGSGD